MTHQGASTLMSQGKRQIRTRRGNSRFRPTSASPDVSIGNLHVPCHHLDQAGAVPHQLARFSLPPADIPRRPNAPIRPRLASHFRLALMSFPPTPSRASARNPSRTAHFQIVQRCCCRLAYAGGYCFTSSAFWKKSFFNF